MTSDRDDLPPLSPYTDEVLCANWHPLVHVLAEPSLRVQKTALDVSDVEGFLARLYLAQRI